MQLALTTTPTIVPAATIALAFTAAGFRWFTSRARRGLVRSVLRMAEEICSVAATIHADISAGDHEFARLVADCNFLGRRAAHFLEQRKGLRRMSAERLQTALERLHDDHRRMVELRLQVDAEMSRRRRERRQHAGAPELAQSGS